VTSTDEAVAPGVERDDQGRVVVDFPLRGDWTAVHTPGSSIPSHGTNVLGQRYAFDLIRVAGRTGLRDHPASTLRQLVIGVRTAECYGWGQPIHSATDGEVVTAVDGIAERSWRHPIRELFLVIRNGLSADLEHDDLSRYIGNHVVVRLADAGEVYAAYGHMTPGSVAVSVGDTVRTGDVLGRVGHSGNSTAPHLHFQLMDRADPRHADGIACVFREYEVWRDDRWERVERSLPFSTDRLRYRPDEAVD
jgi:murein DD-endopeptidase MepM/ murein hydrolase activator NlpD